MHSINVLTGFSQVVILQISIEMGDFITDFAKLVVFTHLRVTIVYRHRHQAKK